MENALKRGSSLMPFSRILQGIFRAIYHDQTTKENSKLGTMCIFWGEKFDLPLFFQNSEIEHFLWRHKVKIGPKKGQIYSNCDKKVQTWRSKGLKPPILRPYPLFVSLPTRLSQIPPNLPNNQIFHSQKKKQEHC